MRLTKSLITFLLSAGSLLSAQTITTLLTFNGTNGADPLYVTFVQGRDGRLYGTTYNGGTYSLGTVVKINLSDNNSIVLHSFSGADGSNPGGGVTLATNGK